jgi:hypothetical protein
MEIQHDHQAKSFLAKLLASENITVQHSPKAKTAWFDIKNRILMLPVWREMSGDLYDMLVVHEVGHALDTPAEDFVGKLKEIAARCGETSNRAIGAIKGFVNVIEDARIDKRQKRRFPGSRRNYVKGYKELIDRDFFGTAVKDVNTMSFIDRLNIYFKGGIMMNIKFSKEEKVMLRKVEDAETFEEVLALTEEIFRWSKEKMEKITTQDEEEENVPVRSKSGKTDADSAEDDEDDYDYGESDDEDDSDDEMSDDDYSGTSRGGEEDDDSEDDEDERNGSADTEDGDEDDSEDEGLTSESGQGDLPESLTEKTWQEKSADLVQDSGYEYIYMKLPQIADYTNMVDDYKVVLAEQREEVKRSHWEKSWLDTIRGNLNEFKVSENSALSFMVKEFEMRKAADEYTRTSIAKTGVIDTNKLHSYKYNDDLFRRITTVATGKNHGFVMFVDWSGSMQPNLAQTVRQMLSLVMFCKRVQVPFEVYTFRTVNSHDRQAPGKVGRKYGFTSKTGEMDISDVAIRNILSSRMNIQELNESMFHLFIMATGGRFYCDSLNGTPLNPCIVAASEIVNRFKARSKVQVVNTVFLTDGDSDGLSGVVHEVSPGYGINRKYILQDDITKRSYEFPAGKYSSRIFGNDTTTPIFLKILKERTGCNLIGFFICSNGFSRNYERYHGFQRNEHYAKSKQSWNDNGFFGVTSAGYDEYYIINSSTFKIASSTLKVGINATKRTITSAFMKFSEKKTVSRVLLSQVVKRITA